ncbi:hypothetical protein RRG08_001886 [Elysia crispata]|uniref:Uncharacterized protein n=1 Tax=Elysia crispata TaxID=231223 RepID=A0AAE1DEW2_9GAST|nr:hypothetical protein RRG08_001886 [Elysia crispata]
MSGKNRLGLEKGLKLTLGLGGHHQIRAGINRLLARDSARSQLRPFDPSEQVAQSVTDRAQFKNQVPRLLGKLKGSSNFFKKQKNN